MTKFGLIANVVDVLKDLSDREMVEIHNEYCYAESYYDEVIEYVDSFDEYAYGMKPTEIVRKYGDLDLSCDYFVETIYGVDCFDHYRDAGVNKYNEIAEYCVDNDEDFGCIDIRDCLNEAKEEDE